MKYLLFTFFSLFSVLSFAQVGGVDYLMKYNCETEEYDVSIVILEGSATTIPQRAQFNAQISLVVPTGEAVILTDFYMPLQNNQMYTGTEPLIWYKGTPTIAPDIAPENDYYSITPTLSPASFYNDLAEGDVVKVFSFTAGESGQYDDRVRFFNNDDDPDFNGPGTTGGGSYANGFTLGGPTQLYNGNVVESCITSIDEEEASALRAYPNPFTANFTIEVPGDGYSVQVISAEGKVYHQSLSVSKGLVHIEAVDFPSGVYFVNLVSENHRISKRVVKI